MAEISRKGLAEICVTWPKTRCLVAALALCDGALLYPFNHSLSCSSLLQQSVEGKSVASSVPLCRASWVTLGLLKMNGWWACFSGRLVTSHGPLAGLAGADSGGPGCGGKIHRWHRIADVTSSTDTWPLMLDGFFTTLFLCVVRRCYINRCSWYILLWVECEMPATNSCLNTNSQLFMYFRRLRNSDREA